MAQSGRIWHNLAGFQLDFPDWGVLSSTEMDSVFVFSGLASSGRRPDGRLGVRKYGTACGFAWFSCLGRTMSFRCPRRTVGLEAGTPPSAEGRSRGSACATRVGTGFRWAPGRWHLDGTDMSPRMATRHVWRRALRPAAGTFCRRRGCSHPRKGRFGDPGIALFRSRVLPFFRF